MESEFHNYLLNSIRRQEMQFNDSLILNPVENIPTRAHLLPASSFLHGLYNSDKIRNESQMVETKIQFAGRERISFDVVSIYKKWAKLLGAEDLTMRLLSGLHSHMVIFMAIGDIGDTIMLLPEEAGGHMSTNRILQRLGYHIIPMAIDNDGHKVDVESTLALYRKYTPKFLFIDRSEGLCYEDFTLLISKINCYCIFDASQYLSNILAGQFKNPFDQGFNLVISTIHKNFPGPQRAIAFTKKNDTQWQLLKNKLSTYVSNMHVFSIYSAGLILEEFELIKVYALKMTKNAYLLEKELHKRGLPVIQRKCHETNTHHIWVSLPIKREAFELFRNLEKCGLLTNYRYLPYGLGFGLRLGTSAATYSGLTELHIASLADIISKIYHQGFSLSLKHETRSLIRLIKQHDQNL